MLDVLRSLKGLLKISRVHVDDDVFRLHYTFTVIVLLAFSIIVTTKQYVGEPITCVRSHDVPESVVNTFCWIEATYSLPDKFDKVVGVEVPYPGVASERQVNKEEHRYHKYYQWVCFMLFFQAVLFYAPRWLWRSWENGKIESLMMDLDVAICADGEKGRKKKLLVDFLISNLKQHNWYALKYFICEVLAFMNVVGQMFLMDKFFDGEFLQYGTEVISFTQMGQSERYDPMVKVFPRMAKCRFHKFGPSGTIEVHDSLCVLPLNIINEKIYIFLWFWFIILSVLTGAMIGYRLLLVMSSSVRTYVLHMRYRLLRMDHIHTVVSRGSYGDWFLMYLLGQNLDSLVFREVVSDFAKRITSEPKEAP